MLNYSVSGRDMELVNSISTMRLAEIVSRRTSGGRISLFDPEAICLASSFCLKIISKKSPMSEISLSSRGTSSKTGSLRVSINEEQELFVVYTVRFTSVVG